MGIAKIKRIRISNIQGRYPKFVSMNAFDDVPNSFTYEHTLFRIETDQGVEGIAAGAYVNLTNAEYAHSLKPFLDADVFDLYKFEDGRIVGRAPRYEQILSQNRHLDAAFYDIIGKCMGKPVWALIGDSGKREVLCYDSTNYFADVWFSDYGVRAVVDECKESVKYGFRALKIKLGRGDKWVPGKAGDDRDIEITLAVREGIGPEVLLMADPNYGYRGRFDDAWRLMYETRSANLYWMEEVFPESVESYSRLQSKLKEAGLRSRLAAGEHMLTVNQLEPYLRPRPLIDVVQFDLRICGLLDGAEAAKAAGSAGAVAAPHNWASQIGFIMGLHMARAIGSVDILECDRSTCDVLIAEEMRYHAGLFDVPQKPGLGLAIDEGIYRRKCQPDEIVIA